MEEWREIENYPDYKVSSQGRVYSSKRNIILKPYHDGWNYQCVDLSNNAGHRSKKVHRLVAEAFIPNPLNKPEVNHIHGNKDDNRASELEWVTPSENARHAVLTGLNNHATYNSGRPKKPVMIVETGQTFDSITACAKALGCTRANIISYFKLGLKTCMGHHIKYLYKENDIL